MAVIFDLDMTMVDSSSLEPLRKARKWPEVYQHLPQVTVYDGIRSLLSGLREKGIPTAIVTSSPRPYCEKVMKQCGLHTDVTVCYHDTTLHKPHPQPILRALELLKIGGAGVLAIGDVGNDIIAAKAAGTIAVGALWGAPNPQELLGAGPHHAFSSVEEFRAFTVRHFQL